MSSKVVVIGKNSYVGEHLTNHLRALGNDVFALSSSDCNFLQFDQVVEKFDLLQNCQISIVFLAVIKKDISNNYQTYIENTLLINNLIKVIPRTNIQSILYLSSVDVYGRSPDLPIIEQTRIEPDSWYGMAKYTCERMLMTSVIVDFPITILRIPGIFGKGRSEISVIGRMVASAILDGRIFISGTGETLRDYVYLGDLCKIISLLIDKKYNGIINVVKGESCSILDIANYVGHALNIELEIISTEEDERSFDLVFDNSRLKEIFPEFRFIELPCAIEGYKSHS
jgi:nucleoside-diphosphate-sugar epimerase